MKIQHFLERNKFAIEHSLNGDINGPGGLSPWSIVHIEHLMRICET